MIDEEATFKVFGYELWELSSQSHRPIFAVCDGCGKVRKTSKNRYRSLCRACSMKGKTHTEESKALMSAALAGDKNPNFGKCSWNFGKQHTEETRGLISVAMKGKYTGKKNPNYGKRGKDANGYKGGKKIACARSRSKRRYLGFKPLNTHFKGCEAHHITHNIIIYIPKGLHRSIWHNLNTGQGMKVINALALDFLVNGF